MWNFDVYIMATMPQTLVKRPGANRCQVSERVVHERLIQMVCSLLTNIFGTDKCQIMGEMFQGRQGHASCGLGRRRPSCEEAHHAIGRCAAHGHSSNRRGVLMHPWWMRLFCIKPSNQNTVKQKKHLCRTAAVVKPQCFAPLPHATSGVTRLLRTLREATTTSDAVRYKGRM